MDFYDRLDTGWSSYRGNVYTNTKNRTLTDSEFMLIATVLQKRDLQQTQEQERIGYENGTFFFNVTISRDALLQQIAFNSHLK